MAWNHEDQEVWSLSYLNAFFDAMREAGSAWGDAVQAGDTTLADEIISGARELLVSSIFSAGANGTGDISMQNSRIYTSGSAGDILLLAGGDINVGLSSIAPAPITGESSDQNENSGIYTTAGGAVRVYAKNDINVNESRIMTFAGGDIDVISDYGDINAGRGSKAALASSTTYVREITDEDGNFAGYELVYEPPAVGSGVRATAETVDLAGDIYPTAWKGLLTPVRQELPAKTSSSTPRKSSMPRILRPLVFPAVLPPALKALPTSADFQAAADWPTAPEPCRRPAALLRPNDR